ncbi:hypothetical protein BDV10DRAFT_17459 [Aspergillus recurvatus]
MQLLFSLAALAAAATVASAGVQQQCNAEEASVRKEWSSLTPDEQLGYIDAVWCLRSLPSRLPTEVYPGVQDRVDDFVATHINLTMVIHRNAPFLPWHRHYIHLWETALREECGYNGTVPYWNWSQNSNLYTNPIFDTTQSLESSLSLSGDGAYIAPTPSDPDPDPGLDFAPSHGGGCVLDGPFKDWPVRMGPFAATQAYAYAPVPENAFAHNPRCLQRNLDVARVQYYNNASVVESLLSAPSIAVFQDLLDRTDPVTWQLVIGAHGGGHISVGPTLADVFASPQDPVFMLHHGFIDRLWDAWQRSGSDAGEGTDRMKALNGTTMYTNPPGAEEATLDTVMEFGVLGGPKRIGEVMDVRRGEYCYRYE